MKTNLDVDDMAPLDPGCPHCGAMTAHPNSSRPVALEREVPAAGPGAERRGLVVMPKQPVVSKPKKAEPLAAELGQPDGKFAYELFVAHMGHKEVAVSWEKLTGKAQQVWTGVARGLERRTIDVILAARARFVQESKR